MKDNTSNQNPYYALAKNSTLDNGSYCVGPVLGEGGFSITYKAQNRVGIVYAVKECFPRSEANRDHRNGNQVQWINGQPKVFIENQRKEALEVAKIKDCPTIVPVRDAFFGNNTIYVVMDYVEGITLKEYIKLNGKMAFSDCVKLLSPLMEDMGRIHEQYHLIHRDITPNNIMVQKDGTARLLDFGALKVIKTENLKNGSLGSMVIGTKGFRTYEQSVTTEPISTWTDVYSFCATILFCITGKIPADVMERMTAPALNIPDDIIEPISPRTKRILEKGMAVFPKDRYQTINQLLTDLKRELNFVWWEKLKDNLAGNDIETEKEELPVNNETPQFQPKRAKDIVKTERLFPEKKADAPKPAPKVEKRKTESKKQEIKHDKKPVRKPDITPKGTVAKRKPFVILTAYLLILIIILILIPFLHSYIKYYPLSVEFDNLKYSTARQFYYMQEATKASFNISSDYQIKSSDPRILRIDTRSNQLIARNSGDVTLTVSHGLTKKEYPIHVYNVSISISADLNDDLWLAEGEESSYSVSITPDTAIPEEAFEYSVSSSQESVMRINSDNQIITMAPGTANILVKCGAKTVTKQVEVYPVNKQYGLSLTSDLPYLKCNREQTVTIEASFVDTPSHFIIERRYSKEESYTTPGWSDWERKWDSEQAHYVHWCSISYTGTPESTSQRSFVAYVFATDENYNYDIKTDMIGWYSLPAI